MKNSLFSHPRLPETLRRAAFCLLAIIFATSVSAADSSLSFENFSRQVEVSSPFGAIAVKSIASVERAAPFAPFVLTLEIEKPRKFALVDDAIPSVYGDFDVILSDESRRDAASPEREILVRRLTLYPRRRGTLVFPPLPLRFFPDANDSANNIYANDSITALLPSATLEIPESDAPPSVDEIEPDYSPIRVFPAALVAALTVAVLAVAAVVWFVLRRSNRPKSPNLVRESPSEEALRRLAELKASRLYLENDAEFYPVVASILRRYLSAEFGIDAEEMTTRETLLAVDKAPLLANDSTEPNVISTTSATIDSNESPELSERKRVLIGLQVLKRKEIRERIERTLTATDLVKFARRRTTFDNAKQIFESARQIVVDASRLFAAELKKACANATTDAPTISADQNDDDSDSIFPAPAQTNERR